MPYVSRRDRGLHSTLSQPQFERHGPEIQTQSKSFFLLLLLSVVVEKVQVGRVSAFGENRRLRPAGSERFVDASLGEKISAGGEKRAIGRFDSERVFAHPQAKETAKIGSVTGLFRDFPRESIGANVRVKFENVHVSL